jgi:hypothetical protein
VGWRLPDNPPKQELFNLRSQVIANGHKNLVEQQWADEPTNSTYDTWDFNDGFLIAALAQSNVCPVDPPPCTIEHQINSEPIYPGRTIFLKIKDPLYQTYQYNYIGDTISSGITCDPRTSPVQGESYQQCLVINPPENSVWTHTFKRTSIPVDPSCPSQTTTCPVSIPMNIEPPLGFLRTYGGDTYIKNKVQQVGFPNPQIPPENHNISTYWFGTNELKTNLVPGDSNIHSTYKFLIYQYFDLNMTPPTGWYAKQKYRLENDPKHDKLHYGNTDFNNLDTGLINDAIVFINGSLNIPINSTCTSRTIFLIRDNLNIIPDFTISGNNNGCLFIVGEITTIQGGNNKSWNNPDLVHAFIITKKYYCSSR